ncbi:MAG: hypothetical protein JWN86_1831 [Planctomycetota bacterium]|nr:hypothetical protein [Planctomycetota bacterium]
MPFTPFHFGVGLAMKSVLLRRFHLGFFIALQVVIDLESLYNLVQHRYPVHRFLHTFVGATLLAVASSALVLPMVIWWRGTQENAAVSSPGRIFASLLATALFATWSHVVLDGIMHKDAQPFWPISAANPMLRLIGVGPLHLACVALGLLGGYVLALRIAMTDDRIASP